MGPSASAGVWVCGCERAWSGKQGSGQHTVGMKVLAAASLSRQPVTAPWCLLAGCALHVLCVGERDCEKHCGRVRDGEE